jgi:hypothetical protein
VAGSQPAAAPAPGLEQSVGQIAELRDLARSVRPEMTVRHSEFGEVTVRLESVHAQAARSTMVAAGSDWRAVLSARDPGFVPAVQAALAAAESGVQPGSASAQAGHNSPGSNPGQPGAQSAFSQGGLASGSGQSEQRYGSSPGGTQASWQPSSGEDSGATRERSWRRGASGDEPGARYA